MTLPSNAGTSDRRVTNGQFQWREDYTRHLEHVMESLMSVQLDYNKLTQQVSTAQTPYDIALAWSDFAQCRLSHVGLAFNETLIDGLDWKSSVPRAPSE